MVTFRRLVQAFFKYIRTLEDSMMDSEGQGQHELFFGETVWKSLVNAMSESMEIGDNGIMGIIGLNHQIKGFYGIILGIMGINY